MPRVARPLAPPIVVLALVVLLALALPVALAPELLLLLLLLLLEPLLEPAPAVLVLLLPPVTTSPSAFDPLCVFVVVALVPALELCGLLCELGAKPG